jgi:hypothetical protein
MRALSASAVIAVLLAAAGEAAAEPPPTGADTALQAAVGKALLEEGQKLVREDRLNDALEKLEGSVAKDASPAALLALGDCQEKLGATASAWETFRRAVARARELGDEEHAAEAADRVAELKPRLSLVKIEVTASRPQPDVTLDDRALPPARWGVLIPLDLGRHTLRATAPGKPSFTRRFEVSAEGEAKVLRVPELAPLPPVPYEAWTPEKAPPLRGYTDWKARGQAAFAFAMTGLVLSAVVTPIVVGVGASTKDEATSDRLAIAGAVCIGTGLPMLIGGYVGAVNADKHVGEDKTRPRLDLAPVVARDHGGFSLRGTF